MTARAFDNEPTEANERAWERAFAFEENLRVFVLAGVKVEDPFKIYNN